LPIPMNELGLSCITYYASFLRQVDHHDIQHQVSCLSFERRIKEQVITTSSMYSCQRANFLTLTCLPSLTMKCKEQLQRQVMPITPEILTPALRVRQLLYAHQQLSIKELIQRSRSIVSRTKLKLRVLPFLQRHEYVRHVYVPPIKSGGQEVSSPKWYIILNCERPLLPIHRDVVPIKELEDVLVSSVDDAPQPSPLPLQKKKKDLGYIPLKTTAHMSRTLRRKTKQKNRLMKEKAKTRARKLRRREKELCRQRLGEAKQK
jgi:hypothetical protein